MIQWHDAFSFSLYLTGKDWDISLFSSSRETQYHRKMISNASTKIQCCVFVNYEAKKAAFYSIFAIFFYRGSQTWWGFLFWLCIFSVSANINNVNRASSFFLWQSLCITSPLIHHCLYIYPVTFGQKVWIQLLLTLRNANCCSGITHLSVYSFVPEIPAMTWPGRVRWAGSLPPSIH